MLRFIHRVSEKEDGLTLRTLLKRELRFSTTMVQKLKATDGVRVAGQVLHVYERVSHGMEVEITLPEEAATDAPVEQGPLSVLYEDDALLAVAKPAGMLTHPSLKQHYGTLISFALGHITAQGGMPVLHPLHRLDRDTSGIVVFAKHAHVQAHWMEQLRQGLVEKEYVGILCGELPQKTGVIALPIGRDPNSYLTRRIDTEGLSAQTSYQILETHLIQEQHVTIALLHPLTGRTHQLRVHCHALGAPLLGDTQYQTPASSMLSDALHASGQLLHAWRLSFLHPFTGTRLSITCPMTRHIPILAAYGIGVPLPRSAPPGA